jgi:hypothetical protein
MEQEGLRRKEEGEGWRRRDSNVKIWSLIFTGVVDTSEGFLNTVHDIGEKFLTNVADTGEAPKVSNIGKGIFVPTLHADKNSQSLQLFLDLFLKIKIVKAYHGERFKIKRICAVNL